MSENGHTEDDLWDALNETMAARCCDCPSCNYYLPPGEFRPESKCVLEAAVEDLMAHARDEVASAFVAWAAKNEIAEPPLDWAWFGEIARRYSSLHEASA